MKCVLSEAAYKWHDGRQWHVGKLVKTVLGEYIVDADGTQEAVNSLDDVLVRHSHTGELEFVQRGKLSVYEVKEQPTNTGKFD